MRLALVLHAHLPWVRECTPWSATERWFHEALWECYLPLLGWLERRRRPVTLSVSPPLAAMLDDELLRARSAAHFAAVAELNHRLAPSDALRTHYEERLDRAAAALELGSCARLARLDHVERITTSATHAFLPGLAPVGGIRPQIAVGLAVSDALFSAPRRGGAASDDVGQRMKLPAAAQKLWLPECAWSRDVDHALADEDVAVTVVDEHALSLARPKVAHHALLSPSGVAYVARSRDACLRVWSNARGYPGHAAYREFFRDAGFDTPSKHLGPFSAGTMTGLKYHRITGSSLAEKDLYDPGAALAQIDRDARDFAEHIASSGEEALLLAFDAELFGHWWHEGLAFLDRAADHLTRSGVELVRLSELTDGSLPVAEPAVSTWGRGGFGADWLNPSTARIWRALHRAHLDLTAVTRAHPDAAGLSGLALDHAIEATLSAQASDWLYMIHNRDHADYAAQRIRAHLEHAARMLAIVDGAPPTDERGVRAPRTITAKVSSERLRATIVGVT